MNVAKISQKFIVAITLLSIAFFSASEAHAKKSFFEGMFPFLYDRGDDEIIRGSVMKAPFADSDVKIDESIKGLPQNAIPLDQPHRSDDDVTRWVITSVSQALTFQDVDYEKEINQAVEQFFTTASAAQYQSFLTDKKIVDVLKGKRYRMNSFTQGDPVLVNEGALKGRYRWLYEVPVMVSYMDRRNFDYREKNAINQQYSLQIQVGRSDQARVDGEGLAIESWTTK